MLGTPPNDVDFVAQHLLNTTEEQRCLLERIPTAQDVQSAWLLFLHCAAAVANYQLRPVQPDAVEWYARSHDENIWQCLGRVLHVDLGLCSDEIWQTATHPDVAGQQVWLSIRLFGPPPRACARAGVLGKRGWALESVVARICRERGGRVTTNVLVRDLDLALPGAVADGRRLGTRAAVEDGAKVTRARRRKETTYPEPVGRHARARLVVLGGWQVLHGDAILLVPIGQSQGLL